MAEVPAFDPAELAERFEGSAELLPEVIAILAEEAPKGLAAIREALAAGDARSVSRGGHSLKGALATIAAGPARDLAGRIETEADQGRLDDLAEVVDRLESEIGRLHIELSKYEPPHSAA